MAIMAEAQMGMICFFLGRAYSGYTMAPSGLKTGKVLFAAAGATRHSVVGFIACDRGSTLTSDMYTKSDSSHADNGYNVESV